jgi:hypothetical protein
MLLALVLAGCGGGERQDANAPSGTWEVTVTDWNFPETQPLGRPVDFELTVRNDDQRDIPQLIVTIAGLKQFVEQRNAATITRPIWIVNDVNYSDVTPYNSALATSYNLGPLAAGDTKEYKIGLTPLRRGEHRVGYSLSGDLFGKAKLVRAEDGGIAGETRVVRIDPTPDFDESIFED